jgi:diguanylate cyclase
MSPRAVSTRDTAIATLPELVITLHRNGTIIDHNAVNIPSLPVGEGTGGEIELLWPESLVALLRQLARKASAVRGTIESSFEQGRERYELRVSAQGPDRLTCSIRPLLIGTSLERSAGSHSQPAGYGQPLERRDFLRRLRDSIAIAALRERPLAVALIHIDGIVDIAQVLDPGVARELMSALLERLPSSDDATGGELGYVGQLSDGFIAQVLQSMDRDTISQYVSQLCASLREPICIGGSAFHLTPYAGVAILGQDASGSKMLLNHARRAAAEARACGSDTVCFFTDTLKLESLSRLDIMRELREAIAQGHIGLRYVARHDLATGQLVARVGYLRWQHPLRGEIRPSEFLCVAEATGLAIALSRAGLSCLQQDYAALAARGEGDVRISFGALRHHVLHDNFARDVEALVAEGGLPAEHLELRIAEKTCIACEPQTLKSLHRLGLQLVVDEVGRGLGSLDWLARAPIWGLQLDRAWVTALHSEEIALNEVALKVCRAAISVAKALDLEPIATGVDNVEQRNALLSLGCPYGAGDLYRGASET